MSTNLFSCKILNFAKNEQNEFFCQEPSSNVLLFQECRVVEKEERPKQTKIDRNDDFETLLFLPGIRYIQKLSAFLPGSLWQN
jgi:hypothetical protein